MEGIKNPMLKNKNIIIIGANGDIGRSIAERFDSLGANLILTSRNLDLCRKLQLTKTHQLIEFDFNKDSNISSLSNYLKQNSIKIDGLVNASGIHHSGPIIGTSDEEIDSQLKINLEMNIMILKNILPFFISNRNGSLVFLSSVSAHRMTRGHAVYSASKAGLEGLIKATASEVAKRNVRLNLVSPGPVKTKMLDKSINENGVDPSQLVPMGRLIKSSEIADACAFLISDLSTAITGVCLPVDGGYLLW